MTAVLPLGELARQVELEACVKRLLGHLFPLRRPEPDRSGRYRMLEELIGGRPKLLRAIRDGETKAALAAWSECVREHATDISLHHTLAVIYREEALAEVARDGASRELLTVATGLWALLLETKAFWRRRAGTESSDGVLAEQVVRELFALHLAHGDRALTGGQTEVAAAHLRCLTACHAGPRALIDLLAQHGLPYAHPVERKSGRIAAIADEIITSWCNDIIRVARLSVDDPDAIRALPPGIKKNYEGGIRYLEAFARLGVPQARVLTAGLEWYNDWSYCLYTREDHTEIQQLMDPAGVLAAQLEPLCTKGRGHVPDNQALSQHYLLRGFVAGDPEAAQREYEESLEWNPANGNAADLLKDNMEQVLFKLLSTAMQRIAEGDFEQAYEIIDGVEQRATDKAPARRARAAAYDAHGQALAKEGRYKAALDKVEAALLLVPDAQSRQHFAEQLRELAPEEENLMYLRVAEASFEKKDYTDTLDVAAKVPAGSKFIQRAQNLRSGSYFYRALELAKVGSFAAAVEDLRAGLGLNSEPKERKVIQELLDRFERRLASQTIEDTLRLSNWQQAFKLIDTALAQCPRSERKEHARYLAGILNEHAVAHANQAQLMEQQFSKALASATDAVNERLELGDGQAAAAGVDTRSLVGDRKPCAVCGSGQPQLVDRIVLHVVGTGGLEIKGVWAFWAQFDDHLCAACRNQIKQALAGVAGACSALRKAIAIDPKNQTAKTNLEAIARL